MEMPMAPDSYWFRAKTHGWGWGLPCAWQGWVVLAVYLVLVLAGIPWLDPARQLAAYLAYTGVLTAGLLAVCWRKGEPARWRWGGQ
jgi:hypothetical protein